MATCTRTRMKRFSMTWLLGRIVLPVSGVVVGGSDDEPGAVGRGSGGRRRRDDGTGSERTGRIATRRDRRGTETRGGRRGRRPRTRAGSTTTAMPSPSALTSASFSVQRSKKRSRRASGASVIRCAASCGAKKREAIAAASTSRSTDSTSTPTSAPAVTAQATMPRVCDRLNDAWKSPAPVRNGLPLGVFSKRQLRGSRSSCRESVRRRSACAAA